MTRITPLLSCMAVLLAAAVAAQQPVLVRDINTLPRPSPPSDPYGWVSFKGAAYFEATTATTGRELFRSNGTAATTTLVVDAAPGPAHGIAGLGLSNLTVAGNLLYYQGMDLQWNRTLWRTDGTAAGTWAFSGFTFPSILGALGNVLLFKAGTQNNGDELWRTDGTRAGTRLVKDIRPGAGGSNPHPLGVHGGVFYFRADDGVTGEELWRTDGTAQGTWRVADLEPGPTGSGLLKFGTAGTFFCFYATSGQASGVWRSDGTTAGTRKLTSRVTSTPAYWSFVPYRGRLYFVDNAGVLNELLWSTDGTVGGTGPISGSPSNVTGLTVFGNALFFEGFNSTTGYELWKFDGIRVQLVADIAPGKASGTALLPTVFNNALYFIARPRAPKDERALWKTDGTAAGTVSVKDLGPNALGFNLLGAAAGRLWCEGEDGINGAEPYVSDGTTAGTRLLVDLNPSPGGTQDSLPRDFIDHFGTLLFSADDGQHGRELWRSDGTAAGTRLLLDVTPGAKSSSFSYGAAAVGNRTFFTAGNELWVTDATTAGTRMVRRFNRVSTGSTAELGGWLYFAADDGTTGYEVWRTDGTAAGTTIVKDIQPGSGSSNPVYSCSFQRLGKWIFFDADDGVSGRELWRTDGTAAGTVRVKDIRAGPASGFPGGPVAYQGAIYFSADDGVAGTELWRTDGTAAGTYRVKDTVPGPGSGLYSTHVAAGKLFLIVTGKRPELWVSDGTGPGTRAINSPVEPVSGHVASLGNFAIFGGTTAAAGTELWRSDGTDTGTALIKDIVPGPTGSGAGPGDAIGSRFVYFAANDAKRGWELWVTDGTATRTRLVADLNPGPGHGSPQGLTLSAGRIFLAADDGRSGFELWRLDPGACASTVGPGCGSGGRVPTLGVTDPIIGQTLSVYGQHALPNTVGFLLVSPILRPGIPLARGCYSYIDPGMFAPLTSFVPYQSNWQLGVPLPNAPALIGVPAAMQAFFAPTPAPIGIDFTNGVHLRLGR